jgi:hypothetical protein
LDVLSGYNLLNYRGKILDDYEYVMKKIIAEAKTHQKNWIPFIFPGYDDCNLRGKKREKYCCKADHKCIFFRDLLKKGIEYKDPELNLITITSFNEWHEGTEIEPSLEYGDNYLLLAKKYSSYLNK